MKASELIQTLQESIAEHGDIPVFAIGDSGHELVTRVEIEFLVSSRVNDPEPCFVLKTDPHAWPF